MYTIKTYNEIAQKGLDVFTNDYKINTGENPDAILLRSYNLHDELIPSSVKAIARAGAGVNNIPVDRLTEEGVVVFNTPGANANAVKELVIMSLIASSRNLFSAIQWTKTLAGRGEQVPSLVEAGKKQFVGTEITEKKLGVIGTGSIGVLVANDASSLGMDVMAYDPYISVNAAWQLSRNVKRAMTMEEIFRECDYITVHVPLTEETKGILNRDSFEIMKENVHILNFSRGELVVEDDLEIALKEGKIKTYITDFPTDRILQMEGAIALPHLGASTKEAEENCAVMAAKEIREYLETGNIRNSVNFPNTVMPYIGKKRFTVIHKNIPNMVGQMTGLLANHQINIANMSNRSKGAWAYTIIDVDNGIPVEVVRNIEENILKIDGVKRVRVIG
ncbi:phosphoglycerate dehydrogenase [Pallidibacillus thermolactis]|jgi:D-3-phosphoglycerate dehydrogenase / 2-oxoglutarate reductase|uniref:phosphoglycerate dehydrogenase n=1 Tax=Pallidibacillus thermolactis TaxID=251051 RepID=UPI00156A7434|nr:phosphoglycerate dehydrogenase [Pallidibacillus thermolactis]MCU9601617.1 phosphoglycerate dehydrogenase [Pallidibacillus thermolactis subsp. kokeshiiformis]MED1673896.1 phosphoglycerate dehydrogenase [Pallidibacillus thermolactis subsp. kokeshiiformis]